MEKREVVMARINRSSKSGKYVVRTAAGGQFKPATTETNGITGYRSASSGRFISQAERVAAARARVTADVKRGVETDPWIVDLAKKVS
jgi:hypothetical protein